MTTPLPGSDRPIDKVGGHWLPARVGKKVLRPGGRETTHWLLDRLKIEGCTIVEFAPGLGVTAREILSRNPAGYIGVDSDPTASEQLRDRLSPPHQVLTADASHTGLADSSTDSLIGEAMLTMQGERAKQEILAEAARILRPGGRYAIHEMALAPDDLPAEVGAGIRTALATTLRVNARPLTLAEWSTLAEAAGFEVKAIHLTPMALLDPRRLLADEGPAGVARIAANLARQPEIRSRVLAMRRVFRDNREHLRGLGLLLQKH